nr:3-deoxy-7-phosphoheptulonate synthase [uncultured Blautia sp.]
MKDLKIAVNKQMMFSAYNIKNIIVGKDLLKIGGPCSVESEAQIIRIGKEIKNKGGNIIRGGTFKGRTSVYSFQGLGIEGLKYLAETKEITGLPVVTEVLDVRDIEVIMKYTDIIQVGARNVQNFSLLKELGKVDVPIILKNGMSTTIEEWLNCAEYILSEGNMKVILCERGIRTFEDYTRNTIDFSAIAAIKQLSWLPIILDPSHGTGRPELIKTMTLCGIVAGCNGFIIEVHDQPEVAKSDGKQAISPEHFGEIVKNVDEIQNFLCQNTLNAGL